MDCSVMVRWTLLLLLLLGVLSEAHGGAKPRNIIIVEEMNDACFRRLFTGRRLSERHIRRTLPAPTVMDCEQACVREAQFPCEGFNFREDHRRLGRGSCELSARPMAELGPALLRDFIEDREYDFYERRRGGPPECGSRPGPHGPSGPSGPPGMYGGGPMGSRPPPGPFPGPGQRPPYGGPPDNRPPYGGPPDNRPPYGGPHDNRLPYGDRGPPSGPYGGPPRGPPGPDMGGRPPYPPSGPPGAPPPWHQQHGGHPGYGPQQGPPGGSSWGPGTSVGFYGPAPVNIGGPEPRPPPGGYPPSGGHQDGQGGYPSGPQQPLGPGARPYDDEDECFARVWSGQRLDDSVVRGAASPPSLGGCQLECLHATAFTCRAFSYRHGPSPRSAGESCLLTDRPLSELAPRQGLLPDPEFEFYERSSFVQGCVHMSQYPASLPWHLQAGGGGAVFPGDSNQLPPLLARPGAPGGPPLGPSGIPPGRYEGGPTGRPASELECYAEYWPSARLAATAVTQATHAESLNECMLRCTDAAVCRSLSFRNGVHGHNCLLSELAQRDLRPANDFVHDSDGGAEGWRLMAWDWADPRCRDPPRSRPGPPLGPQGGGGYPAGGSNSLPWDSDRDKGTPWGSSGGGTVGMYGGGGSSYGSGGSSYGSGGSNYGSGGNSYGSGGSSYGSGGSSFGSNSYGGSSGYGGSSPGHYGGSNSGNYGGSGGYGGSSGNLGGSNTGSYGGSNYGGSGSGNYGGSNSGNYGGSGGYGGSNSWSSNNEPSSSRPWGGGSSGYGSGGSGGSSWGSGGSGGSSGSWGGSDSWGGDAPTFTVNGKPCARGHVCKVNKDAGFWSCPVGDGSGKDWDYCCSPAHRCGYSEGMQLPWCYVGQSKDQWRPCSERYWPYSGAGEPGAAKEYSREGRLLAVSFLHRRGPPGLEHRSSETAPYESNRLRSLRMLPVNSTHSEDTISRSSNNSTADDLKHISLSVVDTRDLDP